MEESMTTTKADEFTNILTQHLISVYLNYINDKEFSRAKCTCGWFSDTLVNDFNKGEEYTTIAEAAHRGKVEHAKHVAKKLEMNMEAQK